MRVCKVDGCNVKHSAKGYCPRHYMHIKQRGRILDRTALDRNEIRIEGNIAKIWLYNSSGKKKSEGVVDVSDVDTIKAFKWTSVLLGGIEYVVGNVDGKLQRIHRVLLKPLDFEFIDHINGNALDNRRCNLRVVTQAENTRNSKTPCNNTSGTKGVSKVKKNGRWHAYIETNGERNNLGYFKNKDDAIKARKEAALKYHGEFAYEARPEFKDVSDLKASV